MDANPTHDLGLHCDACGYSRQGISASARCPECGALPPQRANVEPGPSLASLLDDPLRSPAELNWLRMTTLGTAILLWFWVSALQVSLVMPIGSFALGAMNFAGPKLNLAATVQRSVGREPGALGVLGCIAVFMQAVGVWLLTTSRHDAPGVEPMIGLRSAARWSAVAVVGSALGFVLGSNRELLAPQSNVSGALIRWIVLVGESTANTLLYLYLLRLARTVHNRRAVRMLSPCMWLVPALSIGGALLIEIDIRRDSIPEPAWHLITAGYGMTVVAASAAAVAGIVQLLATLFVAGFGPSLVAVLTGLRSLPRYLKNAGNAVASLGNRWAVVSGLVLWTLLVPLSIRSVYWTPIRTAPLGSLPAMNFPGPKVIAPILSEYRYSRWGISDESIFGEPAFPSLLAVWLMTAPLVASKRNDRFRWAVRWAACLAMGLPLGVGMAKWSAESDLSKLIAFGVTLCEVPATMLTFVYLSTLANQGERRTFHLIAAVVPLIAGAPMLGYVLSEPLRPFARDWPLAIASGVHATLAIAVSLLACSAVLRLAWRVATTPEVSHLPSAGTASEPAS